MARPRKWTTNRVKNVMNDMLAWFKASEKNIFVIDFIAHYDREFLYKQWISEMSERQDEGKISGFHELLKKAKTIQEARLLKYGASDELNSKITVFCLKNHHDYTDKSELETKDTTDPDKRIEKVVIVKDYGNKKVDSILDNAEEKT